MGPFRANAQRKHGRSRHAAETPAQRNSADGRKLRRRKYARVRLRGAGEVTENSDFDLLVAWEPGRSLLDHAGMVQDLQELFGVKVHVGTEKSLHWYVRDRILREALPL